MEGAYTMAKVRELLSNDELAPCCYHKQQANRAVAIAVPKAKCSIRHTGQWLQAGLRSSPALKAPHPGCKLSKNWPSLATE